MGLQTVSDKTEQLKLSLSADIIIIHIWFCYISLTFSFRFSSVHSLSHVRLFATTWTVDARPPCPSPTPRAYSISCPSSQWCHPAISSSVIPFSSCLKSFPASGSFQMSHSSIRLPKYWTFSFSISSSNKYSGLISFRMDWLDLSHPYMTTGEAIALTRQTFVVKVMSLLFNMLSRFVIAFLPRSKCLNFMAAVTICSDFGTPKN